ncbi:hypothetical protein VPHD479_0131 [Vibrio phage D479]
MDFIRRCSQFCFGILSGCLIVAFVCFVSL